MKGQTMEGMEERHSLRTLPPGCECEDCRELKRVFDTAKHRQLPAGSLERMIVVMVRAFGDSRPRITGIATAYRESSWEETRAGLQMAMLDAGGAGSEAESVEIYGVDLYPIDRVKDADRIERLSIVDPVRETPGIDAEIAKLRKQVEHLENQIGLLRDRVQKRTAALDSISAILHTEPVRSMLSPTPGR